MSWKILDFLDPGFLSLFGLKNESFHLYKLNESMTDQLHPTTKIDLGTRFSQVQKVQILYNFGKIWENQKNKKSIKKDKIIPRCKPGR